MRLSSRLFLLDADDTLHALASTAFMRMLRREDVARIPDFAGQRVRQASIVVEVVDGTPARMVHWTFSMLDIDADGLLDVERLSTQQFARVEDPFEPARPGQGRAAASSMRPGALSREVGPGNLTGICGDASRQRRSDNCGVLGCEWFDEIESSAWRFDVQMIGCLDARMRSRMRILCDERAVALLGRCGSSWRIRLRRTGLLRLRVEPLPASRSFGLPSLARTRPGRLRRHSHDSGPFPCPGIARS